MVDFVLSRLNLGRRSSHPQLRERKRANSRLTNFVWFVLGVASALTVIAFSFKAIMEYQNKTERPRVGVSEDGDDENQVEQSSESNGGLESDVK